MRQLIGYRGAQKGNGGIERRKLCIAVRQVVAVHFDADAQILEGFNVCRLGGVVLVGHTGSKSSSF
ncbi:hypothetical protein D9M72_335230 [compost metagenome]